MYVDGHVTAVERGKLLRFTVRDVSGKLRPTSGRPDDEIAQWCRDAGFEPLPAIALAGEPLTVNIWQATKLAAEEAAQASAAGERRHTTEGQAR